ncbi:unnamed protein product [Microthlaspi erraticum]|uniref:Uncharacterized protein n=1 Tax=Microthlaspi erraticum TaxID=1685480 RepID=A0A6D2JKC8_9BRAS|nr:unnamed protein product [Microthlaspi erraticum]
METATNYDSWPRQRPRRRVDRSKRERLDDVFLPGLLWRAIPVRGREQDSKRAYLCSLLLHQARKFKDNCRKASVESISFRSLGIDVMKYQLLGRSTLVCVKHVMSFSSRYVPTGLDHYRGVVIAVPSISSCGRKSIPSFLVPCRERWSSGGTRLRLRPRNANYSTKRSKNLGKPTIE